MTRITALILAIAMTLAVSAGAALADDWVVTKLRGAVLQQVGADWQPLQRGDVVPDDRAIRTMQSGRAELQREEETISLGPQTQIQIKDRTGKRYTTVLESYGDVSIEAQVENVQHFEVQTPFVAAVVKGTRFRVLSDRDSSLVKVTRGHVQVEDLKRHNKVLISAGQSAEAGITTNLEVSGSGKLPVIYAPNGRPAPAGGATSPGAGGDGHGVNVSVGGTNGVTVGINGDDGLHADVGVGGDEGVDVGIDAGDGDGLQADVGVGGDDGVGVGVSVGGDGGGVSVGVTLGGTHLDLHL